MPYYVIRAIGGLLFLLGALIMAYNVWRTCAATSPSTSPISRASRRRASCAALPWRAGGMRGSDR